MHSMWKRWWKKKTKKTQILWICYCYRWSLTLEMFTVYSVFVSCGSGNSKVNPTISINSQNFNRCSVDRLVVHSIRFLKMANEREWAHVYYLPTFHCLQTNFLSFSHYQCQFTNSNRLKIETEIEFYCQPIVILLL